MTNIEALLNRTEDVEKLADQARHDGRLLSPYEQDVWIAGHASRDAEVERLKKVVRVMADSLSRSWPGYTYAIDIMAFNREALAKAEVILKEGG